jgi:hypothetical protein
MATRIAVALALMLALAAPGRAQPAHNTLSPAEQAAGWKLLFDGKSLAGWGSYEAGKPPAGWRVEDGTLTRFEAGGDIVTVDTFTDFELAIDWKISEGGNSGIFYRAAPGAKAIYESAPEMQVLDDARHRDGGSPLTSAGANYGLHPAPRGVVHAAGEWNQVRILVQGAHVEHWLNGQKIVEYTLGSPEWLALVAKSKFAAWPEYGKAAAGHIGLQDHGDRVWYRNIKLRVIH